LPVERLLILDDDPHLGGVMKTIAEKFGAVVRLTAGPGEFFDEFESWRPTLIALDLVMPQMDGIQVLAELAKRHCGARIIITSGQDGRVLDAAGRTATEQGLAIAGILSKPFPIAAFRALLRDARPLGAGHPAASARAASSAAAPVFTPSAASIDQALQTKQFRPAFQPKVQCADGRLSGFEALARWLHPQYGQIGPDLFIPVAERSGLIDALTYQILDQALDWLARYFPQPPGTLGNSPAATITGGISLAVNISANTLKDAGFVENVTDRCNRFGIQPERLSFELTESSAMDDPVASLALLTRARLKGFHLSLDDFGTGFSSMLQLVRLPFSEIKIDRSFVMTATRSAESRAVVKSVVDLGASLGLVTVAEGVEDAETLEFLRDIGCDLAQGYHISRPMLAGAVDEWLAGASWK
jgi:EAL domain-containing protein (putative c-di-GMP-specific phosphodiesterase class I)/DNA-binding NarL/FixJ family response regulator